MTMTVSASLLSAIERTCLLQADPSDSLRFSACGAGTFGYIAGLVYGATGLVALTLSDSDNPALGNLTQVAVSDLTCVHYDRTTHAPA